MKLDQAILTLANMLGESDTEDEALDIAIAVMEVVRRWEHGGEGTGLHGHRCLPKRKLQAKAKRVGKCAVCKRSNDK